MQICLLQLFGGLVLGGFAVAVIQAGLDALEDWTAALILASGAVVLCSRGGACLLDELRRWSSAQAGL